MNGGDGARIGRRQFNRWLLGGLAAAACPLTTRGREAGPTRLRVAAVQMTPKLADAQANLVQAERLVRDAQAMQAQWIILPEMFTTAAAFHPDMLNGIQPLDGPAAQMMLRLSRQGNSVIGGSFLASRNGEVYNSFLLMFPDGRILRHDKDQPTYWENCFYRGGSDDGVLSTPIGEIGSALCWELIRARTMQRLRGRVSMVLAGSCWWTLSDDVDAENPLRTANLTMLQQAPVHCAQMLGVPVVHGSHAGSFDGFFSPDLADVPYQSTYLGEAMVVDADGNVLARRGAAEGAGLAVADIVVPPRPIPSRDIPETFWMPGEMPEPWKESWQRWLDAGADYYATVTRPYLQTGQVNEFIPPYMR